MLCIGIQTSYTGKAILRGAKWSRGIHPLPMRHRLLHCFFRPAGRVIVLLLAQKNDHRRGGHPRERRLRRSFASCHAAGGTRTRAAHSDSVCRFSAALAARLSRSRWGTTAQTPSLRGTTCRSNPEKQQAGVSSRRQVVNWRYAAKERRGRPPLAGGAVLVVDKWLLIRYMLYGSNPCSEYMFS